MKKRHGIQRKNSIRDLKKEIPKEKEEKGKIGKEEKRAIEINRIEERAIKKWKEGSKPRESKEDN